MIYFTAEVCQESGFRIGLWPPEEVSFMCRLFILSPVFCIFCLVFCTLSLVLDFWPLVTTGGSLFHTQATF